MHFFSELEKPVLVIMGFLAMVLILMVLNILPWKLFLVQSGSMRPTMNVGDVILVYENGIFDLGDVVTYYDGANRVVTHRIVEKDGDKLTTKGDANKDSDRQKIGNYQIIGVVKMVIPKIGYLASYIKTLPGLILGIILPAVILIIGELSLIKKEKIRGK